MNWEKNNVRNFSIVVAFLIAFPIISSLVSADCQLLFLTSTYGKRVQQDLSFTESFFLRNNCNSTVELKQLSLTGTVLTPRGDQPIRLEEYRLGLMDPFSERKIDVLIDTKDVAPGKYSPSLLVTADRSGNIMTATLSFDITVVTGVNPPGNIRVQVPSTVTQNQEFIINVTDVPSGATVSILNSNAEINQTKIEKSATQWIWYGRATKSGTYSFSIVITSSGVFQIEGPYTLVVNSVVNKKIKMDLNPSSPKDGDLVVINPKDPDTNSVIPGCTVMTNGQNTDRIIVEAKKSYNVKIECPNRDVLDAKMDIPALPCQVSTVPENVTDGGSLKISVFDSDTNLQLSGSIYVDNTLLYGDYPATEGSHTIKFDTQKYSCNKNFNVAKSKLLLESAPSQSMVGENITFILSREGNWKVQTEGMDIATGSGKIASFVAEQSGTYALIGENVQLATVEVADQWYNTYGPVILIVIILVVAIVGYKMLTGGKKKPKSKEVKFILHGDKMPPGSEEVTEAE